MTSREHREAVRQGATPNRSDRDIDKHGDDEIVNIGGTAGSSGTGGVRVQVDEQGEVSSISGASGQSNIDRRTGEDYNDAKASPDARRAGHSRKEAIEQQNKS